jgi:hypothetical protein
MVQSSEKPGTATDLVSQAGDRAHGVADWLDKREPSDLLREVRSFAQQRPAAFLLGAALAGVAAGRLTRGVVAARSDDSSAADSNVSLSMQQRQLPGSAPNLAIESGTYPTTPGFTPTPADVRVGYGDVPVGYGDGVAP